MWGVQRFKMTPQRAAAFSFPSGHFRLHRRRRAGLRDERAALASFWGAQGALVEAPALVHMPMHMSMQRCRPAALAISGT
mmetsp:Transcript_50116/g.115667  ORF Transcript_50116/g.115667 Transcript_50116/m.115667 type:complete len:80 (-) Transcript_50116:1586-1825(-)